MDGLGQRAASLEKRSEGDLFLAAAADIYRETRSLWNLFRVQYRRGRNLLSLRRLEGARTCLLEALRIAFDSGLVSSQLDTLPVLAQVETLQSVATNAEAVQGDALEIAAAILGNPAASQATKQLSEVLQAELEQRLPAERVAAARKRACRQSLAEMICEVLNATPNPSA
jgi:hypothetical protein